MPNRTPHHEEHPLPLFEGDRIYMLPLGDLKGKVRREIIEKRVIERSGRVVGSPQEADVIIVSPEVGYGQIENFNGLVVSVNWISESIARNLLLDKQAFLIHRPEKSAETPRPSPNARTTELPPIGSNEELATAFDRLEAMVASTPDRRDSFRSMAYRTAASAIRKFPRPIRTEEDAEELRSRVGPRSVSKIKEYILTGHIKKAEYLEDDSLVKARSQLMGIYGVGPIVASELVRQGFDSVEKLRREGEHMLNENQRIGLKFYEELLPKMPRCEVKQIADIVEKSVIKIFGHDLHMMVCGSYRRGAEFCSDADLIFWWGERAKEELTPNKTLERIIADLTQSGFLIDHFNKTNHHTLFLGICRVAQGRQARRIDMRVWPREGLAATILHATGNNDFNRRMRLIAKKKGYKLNDMGIFDMEGNALHPKMRKKYSKFLGLNIFRPKRGLRLQRSVIQDLAVVRFCRSSPIQIRTSYLLVSFVVERRSREQYF